MCGFYFICELVAAEVLLALIFIPLLTIVAALLMEGLVINRTHVTRERGCLE